MGKFQGRGFNHPLFLSKIILISMGDGLIMPDGSFRSRSEIITDNYEKGIFVNKTIIPEPRNLDDWETIATERRDIRMDSEGLPADIDIEIPTDKPIVIAFMGDQHLGGMYHQYEMMGYHARTIGEHPLFYVALLGDMIDGMYWNPGQDAQILNFREQEAYARALMEEMNGSVLYGTVGDHDAWVEKMGTSMYRDFTSRYNAHLLRGSSQVNLRIGQEDYQIVTAHRLPGHSMYNNNHPQMRESNFGNQGADIYVSAHTHRKGVAQKFTKNTDGGKLQTYITSGPYKYSDEYTQKLGFAQQAEKELGAVFVTLYPDEHRMDAHWGIKQALDGVQ